MIKAQLSIPQWVSLPIEVRQQLIQIFNLPKSGGRSLDYKNGKAIVVSDGHTHTDLAHITVEGMQDYLGSKEKDFFALFNKTIEHLSTQQVSSVEMKAKEVEKENIAKWLMLLRDIKRSAIELGLYEKFKELAEEVLVIEKKKK